MTSVPEIEQEAKIKLSRQDLEKVFTALVLQKKIKGVRRKKILRRYFDTADLTLRKCGFSLRLQRCKEGYEQTLKTRDAAHKKFLTRKEYKNITKKMVPDLSLVNDKRIKTSLKQMSAEKLVHIFTTNVARRYFYMTKKGGAVEIAFDTGKITLPRSKKTVTLSEIEIELKKGASRILHQLQKEIIKMAPSARPQTLSKAEQGVCLFKGRRGI